MALLIRNGAFLARNGSSLMSTVARRGYASASAASSHALPPISETNVAGVPLIPAPAAPSADVLALLQKQKGPWTALTPEEKKKLYFHEYSAYRNWRESEKIHPGKTVAYVLLGTAAGVGLYYLLRLVFAREAEKPRTLTKEWKEAAKQNRLASGANPVTGTGKDTWQEAVFDKLKKKD